MLDGEQARKFVRSRHLQYLGEDGEWHSDPTADLGRITRQQVFVRRADRQGGRRQGLTNPVKLNELVSAGVANVSLDELLDAGDLLSLGSAFAEFDSDDLIGYSIPTESMTTSAGAQVELPLMREAANTLAVFRGLPPGTIMPESVDVTVLNGSGITGQAADAAGALGAVGFHVVDVDSYSTTRSCREHDGALRLRVRLRRGCPRRGQPHHRRRGAGVRPVDGRERRRGRRSPASDFTTIHDQPAPEGLAGRSPDHDDDRDGVSLHDGGGWLDHHEHDGAQTTTTTVIGYSTGEPPDGVDCG